MGLLTPILNYSEHTTFERLWSHISCTKAEAGSVPDPHNMPHVGPLKKKSVSGVAGGQILFLFFLVRKYRPFLHKVKKKVSSRLFHPPGRFIQNRSFFSMA